MEKLSVRERAIARRVRGARESMEPRLSQEVVGNYLGLSKYGYGHYEREEQPLGIEHLFKLSRILGRSVEHFLGLDNGLTAEEDELLTRFGNIRDTIYRKAVLDTVRSFEESDREQRAEFAQRE